jgi:hypothetical protein
VSIRDVKQLLVECKRSTVAVPTTCACVVCRSAATVRAVHCRDGHCETVGISAGGLRANENFYEGQHELHRLQSPVE